MKKLTLGIVIAIFQQGEYQYKVDKGATHCTSGGHEQCIARYCPVL